MENRNILNGRGWSISKTPTWCGLLFAGVVLTPLFGEAPDSLADPAPGNSSQTMHVSITSPSNNASFNLPRVNVSGTFQGAVQQLKVNGIPAFISGNTFEAFNVFLRPGTNVISAVAEDISGSKSTNGITIIGASDTTLSQNDPVKLVVEPVGGFAPLKVTFKVMAAVPGDLKQVLYDFEGNHEISQITHDLKPVTHTFAIAGERFPIVTLDTSAGRFSSIGSGYWFVSGTRVNVQVPPILLAAIQVPDPVDIKWTATSNLYVLSGETATLAEFDLNHKIVRSLTGIGSNPSGLDVDGAGNVYVAVTGNNQVWKYKPTTTSFEADSTFGNGGYVGNKDGTSSAKSNEFDAPFDVAVSRDGEKIVVSDSGNHRIQQFTKNGKFIVSFGQQGQRVGELDSPKGLAHDGIGVYLLLVDSGNDRIILAEDFEGLMVDGASGEAGATLGQFQSPINVAADKRACYVVDTDNNRVQVFDHIYGGEGHSPTPFSPRFSVSSELELNHPKAVAPVGDLLEEKIYIADTGNNRVLLAKFPADNPEPVWNAMKQRALAGDIPGAVSYFASFSAENYRQAFLSIGTNHLIKTISKMPPIKPVFVEADAAQYRFEEEIQGHMITFTIDFVKEHGKWKIEEY